jgi:hypothetical protein
VLLSGDAGVPLRPGAEVFRRAGLASGAQGYALPCRVPRTPEQHGLRFAVNQGGSPVSDHVVPVLPVKTGRQLKAAQHIKDRYADGEPL